MTGIEFFLTQIHNKEKNKYAYEDEAIHYTLLKVLIEGCPTFTQQLLSLSFYPNDISVVIKPESKPANFDMLAMVNNKPFYIEVKVCATLKKEQFQRQVDFIKNEKACGVYIIFPIAAHTLGQEWENEVISDCNKNSYPLINMTHLESALKSISTFSRPELEEITAAYQVIFEGFRSRGWS